MRVNLKKIFVIFFVCIFIGAVSYAHSGRTDSSRGHRDNQNKSGLGNYHYHCGGNPAHLHQNGSCPYSSNSEETSIKVNSNENNTIKEEPVKKEIEKIEITNIDDELEVGKYITLNAKITPSNISSEVAWESSNDEIATVDNSGRVLAKKSGIVTITVRTNNNKIDSKVIVIKDKENKKVMNEISSKEVTDINNESNEASSVFLIPLGIGITAAIYFLHKKNHIK